MKWKLILLVFCTLFVLEACHQMNDDYFALATIELSGGDEVLVDRVQASASLTNLNTRQVTSSSDFVGPLLQIKLLRGAYQVMIEGVVTYTDAAGVQHLRQFRAINDYVELSEANNNKATLNIVFLE